MSRDPAVTSCPGGSFLQVDLASDLPGTARILDPSLVDPWDITSTPASPLWVASRGAGVINLYTDGASGFAKSSLTVTSTDGSPTAVVFNPGTGFVVSNGMTAAHAVFLFATGHGRIEGWAPSVAATATVFGVDHALASYTGMTIAATGTGEQLYAVDYRRGAIDVFDHNWAPVHVSGTFADPDIPAHYHPYNIKNVQGRLVVTYAAQHGNDDAPQGGQGFVDVFDANGDLLVQLASGHPLKAPGAITAAPADFGPFSHALVVGNVLDGQIEAYDLTTGDLLGRLRDASGKPISIDGLHAFWVGNGGNGGSASNLYFVAGIDDGQHGLLGSLTFMP